MSTMKKFNPLLHEYEEIKVYKIYTSYGIAITQNTPNYGYKRNYKYMLTDYYTGLFSGKRFKTLEEAKLFMESNTEQFKYWIDKVNKARSTKRYNDLLNKYRKGEDLL